MSSKLKHRAAEKALGLIQNGSTIGIGSGSTVTIFVELLGEALKDGTLSDVRGVTTSVKIEQVALDSQVPLVSLDDIVKEDDLSNDPPLDMVVDGADEVDPDLNLIKGLGAALLREKIVFSHSRNTIVIVDESKIVEKLGTRGPLPVELAPFGVLANVKWMKQFCHRVNLVLQDDNSPAITDNGNHLAHCWFDNGINTPYELARTLCERPGVVEHGLFLDMTDTVIVAGKKGVYSLIHSQ